MRSALILATFLSVTQTPFARATVTFSDSLTTEDLVRAAANVDPRRCTNQDRGDTGDGDEDQSDWQLRGCVNSVIECCRIAARRGWVNYGTGPDKDVCPDARLACYSGPTAEDADGN